ncbi:MAG: WYL domain-containing protein [Flavobacteriaceae bacterium]
MVAFPFYQENWLLIAICQLRNDFRVFRLDQIQELMVQNQHFEVCREKYRTPLDTLLS